MNKINDALKHVNKVLIFIILMTVIGPFMIGGSKFLAEQVDAKSTGMKVQKETLTTPVIDMGKVEVVSGEEEQILENEQATTDVEPTFIKKQTDIETISDMEAGVVSVDNNEKRATDAGEEVLEITTPDNLENQVLTYALASDGSLVQTTDVETQIVTSEETKEEAVTVEEAAEEAVTVEEATEEVNSENIVNNLQVYNGKIIGADKAIASTIGGVDQVVYAYRTLEEAQAGVEGIPLSGGSYDAQYVGTEQVGEDYYAHIVISGLDGYIDINDVQIIPSSLVKSQSHYENIDGEWVYFEATDPLQENSYLTYTIDVAPEWAEEGQVYYSYDDQNFTTTSMEISSTWTEVDPGTDGNTGGDSGNGNGGDETYYSYFQNLPFNSSSSYTGDDYKSYLKYKGYTNSQYYNATDAFVEAQNYKKVNSLYLFAMANHESLFGTSEYAKECNNFFGWGAYDSNPDNACGNYGYTTPRDGILAQGIHLEQQWGDLEDVRWAGEELGNKNHGVNVHYASDPDWGKKIAQHMYNVDQYLGGKENGYYRIYEITSTQDVYTSYSSKNKLEIGEQGEEEDYQLTREDGNPRVIVTGSNSNYFEFQLPTPRNNSSSTTCKWTDANNGSYPNYSKTYSIKVDKGTASFACDYDSWTAQQAWFPTKTAMGEKTYKVISDASAKNPVNVNSTGKSSTCNKVDKISYKDNGDKMKNWSSTDGNETCITTYYGNSNTKKEYIKYFRNSSDKLYKRIKYSYDKSENKTYYSETTYSTSNGKKTSLKKYYYAGGKLTEKYEYQYYSNDVVKQRTYTSYYSSGKIQKQQYSKRNSDDKVWQLTNYYNDSKGKRVKREDVNYSNGKKVNMKVYKYHSNGDKYLYDTVYY